MATITDAQRASIQKKIDAAVKEKVKAGGGDAAARNVIGLVLDELQKNLLALAPSVVDVVIRKTNLPKVGVGKKPGQITAKLDVNLPHGSNMRPSFSQFGPNNSHQPEYVDLIQIFNNGTNIQHQPPFGYWESHNMWIQAAWSPTHWFRDKEGFIQDALQATKPVAELYGVRIKYSRAYDDGADPFYDYGQVDTEFPMRYAW